MFLLWPPADCLPKPSLTRFPLCLHLRLCLCPFFFVCTAHTHTFCKHSPILSFLFHTGLSHLIPISFSTCLIVLLCHIHLVLLRVPQLDLKSDTVSIRVEKSWGDNCEMCDSLDMLALLSFSGSLSFFLFCLHCRVYSLSIIVHEVVHYFILNKSYWEGKLTS